jgi:hypothetical protein
MPDDKDTLNERRVTYLTLISLFFSLFAAFIMRERRGGKAFDLRPFDLVMLGIATFRLGRLTAYDKVAEALRLPFAETKPDESGAGESVVPKGRGMRRAIGELLSCPICAGTWIGAALVYGLDIAPRPTRAFMAIMSAAGVAELLDAATEALSWTGRLTREEVGDLSRANS